MAITTFERNASIAEMAVEMDRRGAAIERLEQKIAQDDQMLKAARKLLARCHDRIHALPRITDTELAARIENFLAALAKAEAR